MLTVTSCSIAGIDKPNTALVAPAATRTRICTQCRRRLASAERCHRAVDLASPRGRSALLKESKPRVESRLVPEWRVRYLLRSLAKLTWYGATPLVGLLLAIALGKSALALMALVTVAALPFTVMVQGVQEHEALLPRKTDSATRAVGVGATRDPPRLSAGSIPGVVSGESSLDSPARGATCVAYSLTLVLQEGRPTNIMLEDSFSCGFSVDLTDGTRIEIPAGGIVLLPPPAQPVEIARQTLQDRIGDLDLELIPYDEVREECLEVGATVRVHNTLTTRFVGGGPDAGYRDSPRSVLVCEGIPVIELIVSEA